ncbi:MAG: type II toxin-antitoxin system prevent-host-death family antitoxin [Verrucomicrobiales bacterium]|nr:type II toxin-antitoxin system prevent-host-death family antitoxin [Verrucomicrobiales bacterium]
MTTVTISDVRLHLGQLLTKLADEEEIVITSHNTPVARLMPLSLSATIATVDRSKFKAKLSAFIARQRAELGKQKLLPGNSVALDRESYPW